MERVRETFSFHHALFVPFSVADRLIIYPVSWGRRCRGVMGDHCSVQRCAHSEKMCIVGLCSKHCAPCFSINDAKSMLIKHSWTTGILNSSVSRGSPYLCFQMGTWKSWNSRFILIHLHCDLWDWKKHYNRSLPTNYICKSQLLIGYKVNQAPFLSQ